MILALDGKNIGAIEGNVFYKRVNSKKHKMRLLNAYGIDSEAFNNIISARCDTIKLTETDTKATYTVPVQTFEEKSVYKHFKPHRAQRFLELKYWSKL